MNLDQIFKEMEKRLLAIEGTSSPLHYRDLWMFVSGVRLTLASVDADYSDKDLEEFLEGIKKKQNDLMKL